MLSTLFILVDKSISRALSCVNGMIECSKQQYLFRLVVVLVTCYTYPHHPFLPFLPMANGKEAISQRFLYPQPPSLPHLSIGGHVLIPSLQTTNKPPWGIVSNHRATYLRTTQKMGHSVPSERGNYDGAVWLISQYRRRLN